MIAAVEDALSEAVVRKIVAVVRPDLTLFQVMRKNGHGYIRARIRALNRTAHNLPVFVLIDLDDPVRCPADLISTFLPVPRAQRLLFRVAVMEVESWILADRAQFAKFLAIRDDAIPTNPDAVPRPKELIVSLARRSKRREIRDDLVPARGDTRVVGAAFNPRLISFVENSWNIDIAADASGSLRRTVDRLRNTF